MSWTNSLTPTPAFSVIVPVWNRADTLGACLTTLAAQTVEVSSYEVIVVDDGSTDGSADVAAQHGVLVLRQEHAGPGAARNRGAEEARGQLLLFTDADCEPLPDWIEQMAAPFADPKVTGAKGTYRTRQRSLVARFAQAEYEEKYIRLARAEQIDFVDTHSAAYRRDVFQQHGGFDSGFMLDEDQEFSFRLSRAGYRMVFVPEAAVYHLHPATIWNYFRRKAQVGRWKVAVHVRHPGKAVRDSYTPWTQKAQIALLPLTLVALIATVLGLLPWSIVAILASIGLISTGPLMYIAARHGWPVVLVTPGLAGLRAFALGVGLAWGIVGQLTTLNSKPISMRGEE